MFEWDFVLRFGIFFLGVIVLLRIIFFRITPNREACFGMFIFGCGAFFITYLLHSVEMSMGFAFGLFAVFSMLRYRTETIEVRDMTYLFTTIVLALMCAVAKLSYIELAALVVVILMLCALAETQVFAPTVIERKITYDRIDKIQPQHYQALLEELRERTGMKVVKFELGKVDFLTDSVLLTLYCER